jgi:hypothetical protein
LGEPTRVLIDLVDLVYFWRHFPIFRFLFSVPEGSPMFCREESGTLILPFTAGYGAINSFILSLTASFFVWFFFL